MARMKRLVQHQWLALLLFTSTEALASGFQLWEQDNASLGNYHAGYAVMRDASTAFYNPAGIPQIKNQQMIFGGAGVFTNIEYNGTVAVDTLNGNAPQYTIAQGGISSFIPSFHYVAPISESIGFGLSLDVPFGLGIDYGRETILRYSAYRVATTVVDLSPSLGLQITGPFSIGLGIDIQRMAAEFDEIGRIADDTDTDSTSKAWGMAWGYHAGILYQFSPETRAGLSYHSQVVHHLKGKSKFVGPAADAFNGGPIISNVAKTNITLPSYTAFSLYHKTAPQWAFMGTVIYTQWSSLQQLTLQNVAGIQDFAPSTSINIVLPQHYHNTWNLSLGADYLVSECVTLRVGAGFDQSPSNNTYRNTQLPDNDRYAVAFGGHYQATKTIGIDAGWTHLWIHKAGIHNIVEVTGDQTVTTNGRVNGSADVFGAQIVWDML